MFYQIFIGVEKISFFLFKKLRTQIFCFELVTCNMYTQFFQWLDQISINSSWRVLHSKSHLKKIITLNADFDHISYHFHLTFSSFFSSNSLNHWTLWTRFILHFSLIVLFFFFKFYMRIFFFLCLCCADTAFIYVCMFKTLNDRLKHSLTTYWKMLHSIVNPPHPSARSLLNVHPFPPSSVSRDHDISLISSSSRLMRTHMQHQVMFMLWLFTANGTLEFWLDATFKTLMSI